MAVVLPTLADATHATNPHIRLDGFGLYYNLTPESNLKHDLTRHIIKPAVKSTSLSGQMKITWGSGPTKCDYKINSILGAGTYGSVYNVSDADGNLYVIKHLKESLNRPALIQAFLQECIIQILIVLYTENLPNGPYSPRLYEIGYDPATQEGFIRSEIMHNRFDNLINAFDPVTNDIVVPHALIKLSDIMETLKGLFNFNHRDLKADNIMYIKDGDDRLYRVIDFGLSCLTWNGIKISGSWWFDDDHRCFKIDRDMSQLIYEIYIYRRIKLSERLKKCFELILNASVKGDKCAMYTKKCKKHGLTNWLSLYNFVDKPFVRIPYGTPSMVKKEMENFLTGRDFGEGGSPPDEIFSAEEPEKICPIGKRYNKKTRRCVKDVSVVLPVDPIMAPCPPGKIRNPLTRRCIKHKEVAAEEMPMPNIVEAAPCPPNKILNPVTRKCVLKTGAIGKKLLAAPIPNAVPIPNVGVEGAPCPPNKILNPVTRKCVLKTGAIGKKLLAAPVPNAVPIVGVHIVQAVPVCPPNKILNPVTRKCVLKTGAIGKKLLIM